MRKVVLFLVGMFLLTNCGHYSQEPAGSVKSARLYGKALRIIKIKKQPEISPKRFESLTVAIHNLAKGEEITKKIGFKEMAEQVGQDVLNEYELYTQINVLNMYSILLDGEKANVIKFGDKISKKEVKKVFQRLSAFHLDEVVQSTSKLEHLVDAVEVSKHIDENFRRIMDSLRKQRKKQQEGAPTDLDSAEVVLSDQIPS